MSKARRGPMFLAFSSSVPNKLGTIQHNCRKINPYLSISEVLLPVHSKSPCAKHEGIWGEYRYKTISYYIFCFRFIYHYWSNQSDGPLPLLWKTFFLTSLACVAVCQQASIYVMIHSKQHNHISDNLFMRSG